MRRMFLALAVAAIAAPALAADTPADRDTLTARARGAILESCGKDIPVNVVWDTFGIMEATDAIIIIDSQLNFLVDAMAKVCFDAAMKAEVVKQIDSIELPQAGGAADAMVYIHERALHVEYFWSAESGAPDTTFVADEIASRLRGEEMPPP